MKKLLSTLTLLLLAASSGCGLATETQKASGDVRVQIPNLHQGKPTLEIVTLQRITDLRRMLGSYAIFYYAPKITSEGLVGESVQTRFAKTQDGIFIPTDFQSGQVAALYFHVQRLTQFDRRLGLADLQSGPRQVAISTRIRDDNQDWVRDRAYYDHKSDALIFVDSGTPDLPLTINPGVVAHEHFHSIFSKLVLKPLAALGKVDPEFKIRLKAMESEDAEASRQQIKELTAELLEFYLFRALNEGLADYWGYLYSGDEHFVERSLPAQKERNLEMKVAAGFTRGPSQMKTQIENLLNSHKLDEDFIERMQDVLTGYSYDLGSQYARFFKGLGTTEGSEAMATALIKSLQDLKTAFVVSRKAIEPAEFLKIYQKSNPDISKKTCQNFSDVITVECETPP